MSTVFITVSFNNFNMTKGYVESFLKLDGWRECYLIIVDNSNSPDKELINYLKDKGRNIKYLRQEFNLGYMSACNYGYKYALDNKFEHKYVVFSNNDLIFDSVGMVCIINSEFEKDGSLGVISPYALDMNSFKNLNPFLLQRPSKKFIFKLKLLFASFPICWLYINLKRRKSSNDKLQEKVRLPHVIYATHGCIFIIRKELVSTPIDDKYFLYGEEVTVAERACELGYVTKYCDSIRLRHISHSTTGEKFTRKKFLNKKNAIKYIAERYSW